MAHSDFVHLRVHSAYSLLEGAIQSKDLVSLCRDQSMPAVAMTDTNNLFGAMEFSFAAAPAGIQPIIGCQLSLGRSSKGGGIGSGQNGSATQTCDPIVLLVQNEIGYRNILKLVSKAYIDSDHADDPQVPMEVLAAHAEGLLALTGGSKGPVGHLLAGGQTDAAHELTLRLLDAFPARLYMEIQRHGLDAEKRTEEGFLDLAYALDIPLVATNEAFFATADMYDAHDALLCVAEGVHVSRDDRRRLTPDHRFKSAAEMRALFADLPEAVDNTLVIARRTAFKVEKIDPILPPYDSGAGRTEEDELRDQAKEGLEQRLTGQVLPMAGGEADPEQIAGPYWERLEYELDVIVNMGFPGYFLIVADFIRWAKENGIPVGPGRGSGAGSVVAWALTITNLDPLRFDLLFERFLNPERVSMPDFDIDFCQDGRDRVIDYVQDKYGQDHVAQIITFGKLQPRAVLRDVGRVLEMPYGQVDRICKMVPNDPAKPITLHEAVANDSELRQMVAEDSAVARLVEYGEKLEGLYRHASTHAAGVVIGDRPLEELIPLYRDPRSGTPVSGFNMKYVEQAGLVKFDFLGLKTLTVLAKTVELLAERDIELDLATIPFDDAPTFDLLGRGETIGVFQLESAGMIDVMRQLKPRAFEVIIAAVALYRPGPMANIPSYIKRTHGEEEPDYLYPSLEGILKETFGIMVYQEQVMQIAQELSGYSLGNADLLRRAMGKKIKKEMDEQREVFVDGAVSRDVPKAKAVDIFDQIARFADYGFNKSHAAAYALIAYQTAYLKANYPVEFIAASMTLDLGNPDKINGFRLELDRLGIPLLPPDINASDVAFTVDRQGEGDGAVRYALAAIKNVGEAAMRSLVDERRTNGPFADIDDFVGRLDAGLVNKRQLENLVRAGAFDCFSPNRRRLFDGVENVIRHASAAQADRNSDQIGLFGGEDMPAINLNLPNIDDWNHMERLRQEFDAIGFYLSAHPLDDYQRRLKANRVLTIAEVLREGRSRPVNMAGTVISKRERTSNKGNRYAFIQMSDTSGVFEVTVFSEILSASRDLLEVGNSLFVKASAQFEGEAPRFTVLSVERLESLQDKSAALIEVFVGSPGALEPLRNILSGEARGRDRINVVSRIETDREVVVSLPRTFAASPAVIQAIRGIAGVEAVREI